MIIIITEGVLCEQHKRVGTEFDLFCVCDAAYDINIIFAMDQVRAINIPSFRK